MVFLFQTDPVRVSTPLKIKDNLENVKANFVQKYNQIRSEKMRSYNYRVEDDNSGGIKAPRGEELIKIKDIGEYNKKVEELNKKLGLPISEVDPVKYNAAVYKKDEELREAKGNVFTRDDALFRKKMSEQYDRTLLKSEGSAIAAVDDYRGIYEFDKNPVNGQFTNPELSFTTRGSELIDYRKYFAPDYQSTYQQLLKDANLVEKKDDQTGKYYFELDGNKLGSSFEGYFRIHAFDFGDSLKLNGSAEERKQLANLFIDMKLIPISMDYPKGEGPDVLLVYDINKANFYPIMVEVIGPQKEPYASVSTYKEFIDVLEKAKISFMK